MLQAGPKTSAFVVTPVLSALDAVAGAAADAGAAAGALVGALLELVPVLPQAARATVIVAIAPSAARRWNLCTVFPLEQNPVDPGVSSELSKSRCQRFDLFPMSPGFVFTGNHLAIIVSTFRVGRRVDHGSRIRRR
jgi:hypothetical protein